MGAILVSKKVIVLMVSTNSDGTLSVMFISDVNRSRQAAFETTMADFESIIFNGDVAAALADGPITVEEYRGLYDRFIPAAVKHRTISLDRASIKAGKIGIAFLTDDEANGYNIHPTLATSMLPEQHAALVDKRFDKLDRTVIKFLRAADVTVANLLDPHNSSGYEGLYKELDRVAAITESDYATQAPQLRDDYMFIRWLYPTIVTRIATPRDYDMGEIITHESAHVVQALRPGVKVPFDDNEAFHHATGIYSEFEAYFVTAKAILASGGSIEGIESIIYNFFRRSRLPLQNSYTDIGNYSIIIDAINDKNTSNADWYGGEANQFFYRCMPKLFRMRILEIATSLKKHRNSTVSS